MINEFDEIAVGKTNNNNEYLLKMEEEYNKIKEKELEEESKPLEERLVSKNWNIRKNAYTEIVNLFKQSDPNDDTLYTKYLPFYAGIVEDSHTAALETGLEIIKELVDKHPNPAELMTELASPLLEKCCTSTKNSIKNKAKEILISAMEHMNDSRGICDKIRTAFDNKNPKVQQSACNFLTFCINLFSPMKIEYKPLISCIEKLTDSSPPIKAEALEFYKELYRWIKSGVNQFVDKLKDAHKKDLEKSFNDIDAQRKNPMKPTKFFKNDKKTFETMPQVDVEMACVDPLQNKTKLIEKSNTTTNNNTNNPKPGKNGKIIEIDADDDANVSDEDLESFMKDRLGYANVQMFNDTKWDQRKDGFTNLSNYILKNTEDVDAHVETFLKFIRSKIKNFKESNFNVMKEMLNVLQNLCEKCSHFSKKHSGPIVKKIFEKIGDPKLKTSIVSLFLKFMEYHGPKETTITIIKQADNKPPNVLKEAAALFEKAIEEFGISVLPVKDLVDFAKVLAANANPQVRLSATSLLCAMYKFLGPSMKRFLNDIKEATLKVIEDELSKIEVTDVQQLCAKRELKGVATEENQIKGGNLIENLFPRVDIGKKITQKIIKELNEGKWQQKKEALDEVEKILVETNMRILPSGLGELITALKNKLSDGNKQLVRFVVQFITKLVEALGAVGIKNYTKVLMGPLLNNLSDKMAMLREDVVKCIEKFGEMIGFDGVFAYFPTYLNTDNFELRIDLLKLILKNKQFLPKFEGIKDMIPGLIACLIDKSPQIRVLAEEVSKEMLKIININVFYSNLKDFKPAIANVVKAIIEKYSSLVCVEPVLNTTTSTGNLQMNNQIKAPEQRNKSLPPANKAKVQKTQRDSTGSNESDSVKKGKKVEIQMPNQRPMNIKPILVQQGIPTVNTASNIVQPVLPIQQNVSFPKVAAPSFLINASIKINTKLKRLTTEKNMSFPHDYLTQSYNSGLKEIMKCFIHTSYVENAFSGDITKFNFFYQSMFNCMKNEPILFLEISDLIIKWVFLRNSEMQNNLFFNNFLFDYFKNLLDFSKENECNFPEIESQIGIEILLSQIFCYNPIVKNKFKLLFTEFISLRIFHFDQSLRIITDKIKWIIDDEIRTELVNILKTLIQGANMKIENEGVFVSLIECVKGSENIKGQTRQTLLELIYNIIIPGKETVLKDNAKGIKEFDHLFAVSVEKENDPKMDENVLRISKSPILQSYRNEENQSKESICIKLNNLLDQEKLNAKLNLLKFGESNEKIKIFLELNDIFANKLNENVVLLEKNIDQILGAFTFLLKGVFSAELTEDAIELLKYMLNTFYKISLSNEILECVTMETIYTTYEQILLSILYNELENVGENEEGKKIIKSLNALILKLMENLNITSSLNSLIKLMQNYRKDSSRMCSLTIKCLLKLSNIMPSVIIKLNLESLLLSMNEFLNEFDKTNPELVVESQNDDMCLKILRTLLYEIIKIKNESIWNYYKAAIERNNIQDKFLRRWIQLIMRSKMGSLREYRNKFQSLSLKDVRSEAKLMSVSPNKSGSGGSLKQEIQPFGNTKKLMDSITKNTDTIESFGSGMKYEENERNHLGQIMKANQESFVPSGTDSASNQIVDRLAEMKRRLQTLRAQKY